MVKFGDPGMPVSAGVIGDGDMSAAGLGEGRSSSSQLSWLLRLAAASEQGQPHSEAPQAPQMPHRALNHCHIEKPQKAKTQ